MFLILPFRDHNPSKRKPFVNYLLIAACILAYIFNDGTINFEHQLLYALYPFEILNLNRFETFLTSIFLHNDLKHLFYNMLFLYLFGDNLEDTLGHFRYLLFYLVCGLGASIIYIISCYYSGEFFVPVVGASGAISGVIGGYLLLFPRAKIDFIFWLVIIFRRFSLNAWFVLGGWILLEIWDVYSGSFLTSGVATFAHLGGFFCGLVFIFPKWNKLGGLKYWQETGGTPEHPEAPIDNRPVKIPYVKRR